MKSNRTQEYRFLRLSMLIGAIYDTIFGIGLLFFTGFSSKILSIPCPDNPFYVKFIGIFLFILSFGYILAWIDIKNSLNIVKMMILSRTLGFVFMFTYTLTGTQPGVFYILAFGDLFFAFVHLIFLVKKT
jgi:hypothetical protein